MRQVSVGENILVASDQARVDPGEEDSAEETTGLFWGTIRSNIASEIPSSLKGHKCRTEDQPDDYRT